MKGTEEEKEKIYKIEMQSERQTATELYKITFFMGKL
jgi:hypothetical protein